MKMAMKDGKIMLIEVDNTQMAIIKSWNSMKYDRRKNMMIGDCSKELLDKLSKIVRLPPAIESYRQRLDETQRAVDKMRVEKEPEALVKYPVQGKQMEDFLTDVYKNGYADGKESVPGVELQDVEKALQDVKGIGPVVWNRIKERLAELFRKEQS